MLPAANFQVRHSVCALDCPDCCSLLINVDEHGAGSKLRGDPAQPITQGFLCGKVARYLDREYSPERLLFPQKRTGAKGEGRFERISWDEALDTIAARLKETAQNWGPESILPYSYAGTMGYLQGSGMDRRFFHRLGASRLDRTICSSAGMVGATEALGFRYGMEPEQFRNSKLIIAWGANILGTNVHLWPFIVEARRNGARFYTIDPVRTRVARLADRHFDIYPGSDLALALGLMHVIVGDGLWDRSYVEQHTTGLEGLTGRVQDYTPERVEGLTGIPKEDVIALAREYASTRPAAIRLNYGVQRSERGGSAVHAISLLPVLTGNIARAGGGIQLSTSQAFQVNKKALEMPELQLRSALRREARIVNMSELSKLLTDLDPPAKALVVYNSNPAAIAPNQKKVHAGLRRADLFTVVLEQFQTDTADFADILLPVTTFLEHTDLYLAYGHYYLQLARPALAAPGECRSNVEIFRALAERMGFDDECFRDTDDDMIRALLASDHPFVQGITLDRLEREHFVRLSISPEGSAFLPFANGGFGTPSGKCELDKPNLAYTPPVESRLGSSDLRERFPLELVSSKNDDSMNSTFGNRLETDGQTSLLQMDSSDAAPRGIESGDHVRVFNDRGSVLMVAEVDGRVRRGVVRAPSVRWPKHSPNRQGINVLTSDRLTDMGGGPTLYSCLVQVEKCGD
jgi:anaerobic selenocysteine-containing dehydrogenase